MNGDSRAIVLFVHQSAELYGSDRVLLYLVSGLQTRPDFRPVVVLPGHGPLYDALFEQGIEVHIGEVAKVSRAMFSPKGLIQLPGTLLRAMRDLDRVCAGRRAQVVHSNTLAVLGGAVWSWRRRVAHLWHVHEIILVPRLVGRAFPRLVRMLADKVMSNSTLTERWLLGEQPQLQGRSVVVFNGLPELTQPDTAATRQFRARIGAAPDDIVVALVGRLHRWKGQALLVEAAGELRRRGELGRLRFVMVGDPAPGQEDIGTQLRAQAESAGVSDRVTILPFMHDIHPAWFGSQIAVVPSTHPESFGMVAIEAMAAGLPVVGARHGGLLDIVEHEKTGLLLPPGDATALANALARLARDDKTRYDMGQAGRRRQAQHFSVDSQVDRTQHVYRELMTS